MSELLYEQSGTFEGSYPTIPNRAGFVVDDSDTDPLFMTLPIGEVNTQSKNGRVYDREFYSELVRQVNEAPNNKPVTGIIGHPNPDAVSYEVNLPSIEWVGATLSDDGKVWGKAYVYPEDVKLKNTVKRAKKRGAQIATSIWGNAVMDGNRATKPTIKRIDYADPEKAGVSASVATPILTQEMNDTGDNPMPDNNNQDVISELRNDRNQAIQELADVRNELKASQAQVQVISELTELLDTQDVFKAVSEMQKTIQEWQPLVTGVKALGEKPLQAIQEMQETIAELEHASLLHNIVDAINEKVKYEGARPNIAEMMGIERDEDGVGTLTRQYDSAKAAIERLDSLLAREEVQEMIRSMVYKASGGRVTTHKTYDTDWRDQFVKLGEEKARSIVGGKS